MASPMKTMPPAKPGKTPRLVLKPDPIMNAAPQASRFVCPHNGRDTMPDLHWERRCWTDGYRAVAGVDEAGRGALAGPIVAAAVIFASGTRLTSKLAAIDDSKVLSAAIRDRLATLIRKDAVAWAIGAVSASEIDRLGLSRANRLAMEVALDRLALPPDFVLLDAITCEISTPQSGLIHGDAISTSIAAASILAKTERDRIMHVAHDDDTRYHFDRHVGYGTALHLEALRMHGPCSLHRRSFRGVLDDLD